MIPLTAALGAGAASPASWWETEAQERHLCAVGTATTPEGHTATAHSPGLF